MVILFVVMLFVFSRPDVVIVSPRWYFEDISNLPLRDDKAVR